jgi:hypothetical protein
MKKKNLLLLIVAFVFSISAFSQGMPNDWFLDEVNPGLDIALYPETTMVKDGDHSCKMMLLSNEVPYLLSFNYAVTAGSPYTFTLWYLDNDERGSLKVYAEFYDAEGNDIYGEDPVFSEDGPDWQSITWSSTVPPDAVEGYVWVKFYDDPGFTNEAIAYIDGVSFDVLGTNLVSNGSFEEWDAVNIVEQHRASSMVVYPNPFTNQVQISGVEYDQVVVTNLIGQVVFSSQMTDNNIILLNWLTEGVYFLSVYFENELVETTKLLK